MLKMNDLVKLSHTPKSTVLYYVKEGLLPEPVKINLIFIFMMNIV